MNTKELQQLLAKQQVNKGHNPVCENLSVFFPTHECDVLSVSASGYVYEFEVKISKADFKKDETKTRKHSLYKSSSEMMPNYFAYVCPQGLIKAPELPDYAGLYYLMEGGEINAPFLQEIVKPPLLHKFKHDLLKLSLKVCRVTIERLYLGGCKMTVKNKSVTEHNRNLLKSCGFTDKELKNHLRKSY
jgi:hypothetical protein